VVWWRGHSFFFYTFATLQSLPVLILSPYVTPTITLSAEISLAGVPYIYIKQSCIGTRAKVLNKKLTLK